MNISKGPPEGMYSRQLMTCNVVEGQNNQLT